MINLPPDDGLTPAWVDGKSVLVPPEQLEPYYQALMAQHDGRHVYERWGTAQWGSQWAQQPYMRPGIERQLTPVLTDPNYEDWRAITQEERPMKMAQREKLPRSDFALPGKGSGKGGKGPGSYPIDTPGRARSALSRGAANASPAQQAEIKRKVRAKYPAIDVGGKGRKEKRG